jgi:hypothetical protein
MLVDIDLVFNIERANDSSMSMQIVSGDQVLYSADNFDNGRHQVSLKLNTPGCLDFVLSSRQDQDTVCDSQGNIVENKHICLESLSVNGFGIDGYKLDSTVIASEGHPVFWNYNGTVRLTINQDDPVIWIIDNKQLW